LTGSLNEGVSSDERGARVQRHTTQAVGNWRFSAPPALEASRNEPIPQADRYEPPVENISTGGSLRKPPVNFFYRKYEIAF